MKLCTGMLSNLVFDRNNRNCLMNLWAINGFILQSPHDRTIREGTSDDTKHSDVMTNITHPHHNLHNEIDGHCDAEYDGQIVKVTAN